MVVILLMAACTSSDKRLRGLPSRLPTVPVYGTAQTPPHQLPRGDYPFDSQGNYINEWAAEGEAKAGRGAASDNDYKAWKGSKYGSSKSKKTASRSSSKKTTRHTVKKGETLSSIARKYGVSSKAIMSANRLKSATIQSGKTLTIPR